MEPQLIVLAPSRQTSLPPELKSLATAAALDADIGAGGIGSPITSISGIAAFAGLAITVSYGNLSHWKALDLAGPGDVIVIATRDRRDCAEFGAVFVRIARAKGVAAIVTDGLIRDKDEIATLGLPVFAAGVHPASPPDPECGTVGLPVMIAGVQIATGDAVIGDTDGIAIVSRTRFAEIGAALGRQTDKENSLHDSGTALPPALAAMLDGFDTLELSAA